MSIVSVKLIVSTRDGSHGYLEQVTHKGLTPRVFRLASDGVFFEHCTLEAFNIDGARARFYGTNFKADDFIVG